MTATTAPAWTTSGGEPEAPMPTRRELAAQIRAEHAAQGVHISASRANRLAVRELARAATEAADAEAGPDPLTYRDETGRTAVHNVLTGSVIGHD